MKRGDCYVVAFHLALEMDHAVLCHGAVHHPETGWHGHAWVETVEDVGPWVVRLAHDKSNGNNATLPADLYRRIGRCRDVVEYEPDEARNEALTLGHYGPWAKHLLSID